MIKLADYFSKHAIGQYKKYKKLRFKFIDMQGDRYTTLQSDVSQEHLAPHIFWESLAVLARAWQVEWHDPAISKGKPDQQLIPWGQKTILAFFRDYPTEIVQLKHLKDTIRACNQRSIGTNEYALLLKFDILAEEMGLYKVD